MFDELIEYVCVRVDNLPPLVSTGREITIYGRSWAYCPGGADGAHEWQRVPMADRTTPATLA